MLLPLRWYGCLLAVTVLVLLLNTGFFFDQAICCIFRYQRLLNPKLGQGSFARQRIAYDILYQHF